MEFEGWDVERFVYIFFILGGIRLFWFVFTKLYELHSYSYSSLTSEVDMSIQHVNVCCECTLRELQIYWNHDN